MREIHTNHLSIGVKTARIPPSVIFLCQASYLLMFCEEIGKNCQERPRSSKVLEIHPNLQPIGNFSDFKAVGGGCFPKIQVST